MARVLLLVFGGLMFLLSVPGAAQEPVPRFRSGVDLVDVDVSVLDDNRLPVRGLTVDDFTILEDGEPRPIVAFSAVELPPRRRPDAEWMAVVAPDVASNDLQHEGRLVVILIDQSIRPEELPASVAIAEAVVDQLRPGDLAAVAYSTFGVPQNFTADRERLLHAIRQPLVGLPAGDGAGPALCPCGACSLETVANVAEALAPVRQRRKLLVFIGSSLAVHSAGPCSARLDAPRERALRAIDAANLTVYAYDPGGLPTLVASAGERRPAGRNRAMVNLARVGNLRLLPDRTGGRFLSDTLRPADRLAEVFRESDAYYVLGFEPAHPDDGRFHRIEVRVARRGVRLQARRGYFGRAARVADAPASGAPTSPRLWETVASLWPVSDIRLTAAAVPLARPDLSGSVVASIVRVARGVDAPGVIDDMAQPGEVRVFTGAFNREGRVLASTEQVLRVEPQPAAGGAFEYEVVSRLDLPPGRYELRTAVEDVTLGRTGSVYTYVDVPDYRGTDVALSGVLLGAAPNGAVAPADPLAGLASLVPTTRRAFARGEDVDAFVRIYQGLTRSLTAGYVVAEIVDAADTVVYRSETRLEPPQFGASRAVDFRMKLPLDELPAGEYLLGIEARHGNASARRHVRFSVR